MSEFHRMITYLYLYEKNQKTRNVGFAKIEKRDRRCLAEIHMKNTGCQSCTVPVYFYVPKNHYFIGIPLGDICFTHNSGDFSKVLSHEGLSGTPFSLSDAAGIFIPVSDSVMFVSQWNDLEFVRDNFLEYSDYLETLNSSAQNQPSNMQPSPPSFDLTAAEAAPLPDRASGSKPSDAFRTITPENWEDTWKFMLDTLPELTPFENASSVRCVRLELKDLRLLPKYYWYLGNNSFLLHGFFNYRYLIFGCMSDEAHPKRWFLGIPGIFQNPERVMASLFGFPEFRSEKACEFQTGQFGYWFRYLEG